MDFRAAIENVKAWVASGKDAAYQKALGLNRNAPPLPDGSAVGEFGQDNVIGLPFGMQLTPEVRQQLKAYEDAGYTLQYRAPPTKSDDFLAQMDKDLGLSKNAPIIAAITAAVLSSGAIGGETLAGAGAAGAGTAAADLAAADAIAGLTAGGAGAGTVAGIGAGAAAADLAAADAIAGLTSGGTAAGTNALATGAGTNALAAGTAGTSAAGETLAGVAGTGAGTSAAGETLAGTAGMGATGTTAAVADPYALQTAGGALTNSASTAANPYTAPLATAAASTAPGWMAPAASVGSALIGATAATSAANTQANAANQANQLLASTYATQRADLAPFVTAGTTAQNKLLTYLGLTGGTTGADYGKYAGDFTAADLTANKDPGYAFRLAEGQKALERSAAARGGLLSGGTGKALTSFGQDMGSQEYQNAYNRYQTNRSNALAPLFSLTGSGQAAAANQAAAAGTYGAGAANNLTSAGAANAAGTVGTANAIAGGVTNYLNYTSNQDMINAYNARTAAGRSSYGG